LSATLTVVRSLAEDGMTMIMVTHEMAFAREASNRVVFIDAGRVAVEGSPAEVFSTQTNERLRSFLSRVAREDERQRQIRGADQGSPGGSPDGPKAIDD
jgi:polar amino acid transport system ATP-binding protein